MNEKNIKIPEQIAVIGFSNWFMSEVISPKLSTIEQPVTNIFNENFQEIIGYNTRGRNYKLGLNFMF